MADSGKTSLKVMTLNVAHGRRNGVHQVFQRASTHKANLDAISRVIRRERPEVVALQEADGPSYWSGNFNHVDYLARNGEYPHYLQFEQARGMGLSYGTALISELPLGDPLGRAFETSTIAAPKGFLVSMIEWPGHPGFKVDVVSVHFDPVSASIREKQMEEFVNAISGRNRPIILMGDFNCEWTDSTGTLRALAERLVLATFRPDAADIMTFRPLRQRRDWIFVSSEFEFVSHSVLPDLISDHQGVVAEISLRRTDS
jgi:endonuclease/exonuclease/phosphatase family metal-dependent hydrolase